jgi:hypothetical protein
MSIYWIGKLNDGRIVLYDPEIQLGLENEVRLYIYGVNIIEEFPKVPTRQSIKSVNNSPDRKKVIYRYLSYIHSNYEYQLWKAIARNNYEYIDNFLHIDLEEDHLIDNLERPEEDDCRDRHYTSDSDSTDEESSYYDYSTFDPDNIDIYDYLD